MGVVDEKIAARYPTGEGFQEIEEALVVAGFGAVSVGDFDEIVLV